jgi:Xaa-Pro aminopeptidase
MFDHTGVWNPRPDAKVTAGKLLFLDLGATYSGYNTDFNRMAVAGRPTQKQQKACDDVVKITRGTIESVRPGIRASDIVLACREEYEKVGLTPSAGHQAHGYGPHRKIGHGIGLTLSEGPQITTYDETILQPGMTFCLEPPVTTDQGFVVGEQVVLVTDNGHEVLSKADDRLYQL